MKVSFNYNKLDKEGNIKMKRNLKIIAAVLITIIMGLSFTACNPAQTATNNLVKDAESSSCTGESLLSITRQIK